MSKQALMNWLKGRKYAKAGNTWKKGYNKGLRDVSLYVESRGLDNLIPWLESAIQNAPCDSNAEQGRIKSYQDVCEYLGG